MYLFLGSPITWFVTLFLEISREILAKCREEAWQGVCVCVLVFCGLVEGKLFVYWASFGCQFTNVKVLKQSSLSYKRETVFLFCMLKIWGTYWADVCLFILIQALCGNRLLDKASLLKPPIARCVYVHQLLKLNALREQIQKKMFHIQWCVPSGVSVVQLFTPPAVLKYGRCGNQKKNGEFILWRNVVHWDVSFEFLNSTFYSTSCWKDGSLRTKE